MSLLEHCPEDCARITAVRLTRLYGELAAAKAEKRLTVELLSRERQQHRGAVAALREIAEAGDHTDEWEAIDRAKEFLARLATTGRAVDHEC